MPTRLYFTEHTTSEQLRITWETRWHSLSIWLGDNRVQEELSFQQLKRGVSLSLPNGSEINIHLVAPFRERDLIITNNGIRLYGQDPALPNIIRITYQTTFVFASLLVLLGFMAILFPSNILVLFGIGSYSIIVGALLLLLGMLIRRHFLPASILVVLLLGTHWAIGISVTSGLSISYLASTILHLFFGIPLARGIIALAAWRDQSPPLEPKQQARMFRRNIAVLVGALLLPLVIFVIVLFTFYQ